jgi:hypothetical protein
MKLSWKDYAILIGGTSVSTLVLSGLYRTTANAVGRAIAKKREEAKKPQEQKAS